MQRKFFTLSFIFAGLSLGAYANESGTGIDDLDLNSVVFIEEDAEVDLGFNTADYLPENFDPYRFYVDLRSIPFIEEEVPFEKDLSRHLPRNFDPYGHPSNFMAVSYIDPTDNEQLDFDSKKHLPEGFHPYIMK